MRHVRGRPAATQRSVGRGGRTVHRGARAALALLLLALAALAGCSSGPPGPPVLTWYINPDDGGQAEIAQRCTAAAGGRYTIAVSQLPKEASDQRLQLVRRLAANDSSIDIMSLDPPYVPEFAEAGFLAPVPAPVIATATAGVVPSAIASASWKGKLVTVPFWANTQLLWYRKSLVAASGLDLSKPVTWDQVIAAAAAGKTQFAAQGKRAESLNVWFNALVSGAGGKIIENPGTSDPKELQFGFTAPPAVEAARIMRSMVDSGVAGPAFSTESEDESASAFQDGSAAFMVNYPFIWGKAQSAVKKGTVPQSVPDDYGWAVYPRTTPDRPSAPPLGGINLGVGAFSRHADLAYDATGCITNLENSTYYFVSNGNPSAKAASFSDPAVLAKFPMAPVILESLAAAAPRPQTQYYAEVSGSVQRTFHPPGSIVPGPTNQAAQDLVNAVLRKEALL